MLIQTRCLRGLLGRVVGYRTCFVKQEGNEEKKEADASFSLSENRVENYKLIFGVSLGYSSYQFTSKIISSSLSPSPSAAVVP